MTVFQVAACLITLAAVLSYLNYKLLRLPSAIGLMALSLAGSLLVVLGGTVIPAVDRVGVDLVDRIDLGKAVLHGMLGFLLFAGALHTDLDELAGAKWPVLVLSTLRVLMSRGV